MTRKITIAVCAAVLVGAIALFAAEKAREKSPANKPEQDAKAVVQPAQKEGLLDQLITAYKANDREKMGEIIKQMQERREGMRKLAKLNKWHQWAHRRMMEKAGPGWQDGWGMAGPGRQGGWGNQMPWGGPQWGGAPCQTQERRGCCCGCMGGRGAMTGGPAQIRGCACPEQSRWDGRGMPEWQHNRPMRGWACPEQPVVSNVEPSRRDGWGMPEWQHNRPMRGWGESCPEWGRPQRPGWRQAQPQDWDTPACEEQPTDAPPADLGW
jgi:hypothetical protein